MIRFKPIIPKGEILDARKLSRAKKNALDGAAKGALVDFKVTAQTWDHKPSFAIEAPSDDERLVGTNNEIYGYVDEGTKAHDIGPIVPKNKKALTILGKGSPKTRPRVIGSGGGRKGGVVAIRKSTKVIHHPGTDAREFSVVIAEKWGEQLPLLLQRAIDAELS